MHCHRLLATLLIALAGAGCVRPAETTCESGEVCPEGYACRAAGGCLSPAQLAACDGVAPGAACELGALGGVCQDGGCVVVGCGNGVVDAGEVCDDGNTEPGDGCSETCRSLETCGNGIVDIARGEGCDCGSDAAPSPGCERGNSDDVDAECSATCELRRCGDGELGGVEECDVDGNGGLLLREALDCGSFGFYQGALACSPLCRLELTSCAGRCGDGVVDSAAGEACDGVAFEAGASCADLGWYAGDVACSAACQLTATDSSCAGRCGDDVVQAEAGELCDGDGQAAMCADVGYDAGVAACGVGCGFDLAGCAQFGWDHPVRVADVRQVWAEGDLLAYEDYISDTWTGVVLDGDRVVMAPDYTYRMDGAGDVVFAINAYDESFARFTRGAMTFEAMPARAAGHEYGQVLALGPDDALAVAYNISNQLEEFHAGVWTLANTGAGPGVTYGGFAKDATYAYALGNDSATGRAVAFRRARAGGAWTRFDYPVGGALERLVTAADGQVYSQVGEQLYVGLTPPVAVPGLSSAKLGGAYGRGLLGQFYAYPDGYQAAYLGALGLVPLQTPPGTVYGNGTNAFTTNSGVSNAGVYRSRDAFWSAERPIPPAADGSDRMTGATFTGGTLVATSTKDVVVRGLGGWTTRINNEPNGVTSACAMGGYLYATTDYDVGIGGGALRIYPPGGGVTTLAMGRAPVVACLDDTSEALVVSIDAVARGTGTAIVPTWVDNTFFNFRPIIGANAAGQVYGAHRYGGIYRLDGTTFTQVATLAPGVGGCSLGAEGILGCLEGIFVDDAGGWTAIAQDRIFRSDGADADDTLLDGAGLRSVFGSGPDDIWAVGGVAGAWGSIWHWDGAAWSEVAAPLAEPYYGGAAGADEVLLLTGDSTISLIR